MRQIEIGLASFMGVLFGVTVILCGLAIAWSKRIPGLAWLGGCDGRAGDSYRRSVVSAYGLFNYCDECCHAVQSCHCHLDDSGRRCPVAAKLVRVFLRWSALDHGEKNSQRAYHVNIASMSEIPKCSRANPRFAPVADIQPRPWDVGRLSPRPFS